MSNIKLCQVCKGIAVRLTQNSRISGCIDCPSCKGTGHDINFCQCQSCNQHRQARQQEKRK